MKKQVFTLLLVMMSLFSSLVAWGQLSVVDNPDTWYYVALTATPSTTSQGKGKVGLSLVQKDLTLYNQLDGFVDYPIFMEELTPYGNPSTFENELTYVGFSFFFFF